MVQRRHDVGGGPALVVRPPDIGPCHPRNRTLLARGGLRLRLDISTPGGHPVNFGLSVLFVVLASAPLGIGAHTVSTALTGSAVLVSCSSLAPSDRFLDPSACDALTGSAVLVS
jgi:hypothetical protein